MSDDDNVTVLIKKALKERNSARNKVLTWLGCVTGVVVGIPVILGGGRQFYAILDAPARLNNIQSQLAAINRKLDQTQWKVYRVEQACHIPDDPPMSALTLTNGTLVATLTKTNTVDP